MKLFILLISFFVHINLFSQNEFVGKWKLIGYYNYHLETYHYRPLLFTTYYRNFEIEFFKNSNNFKGITSMNSIYGSYETVDNKMKVTRIGGTRAGSALDMIEFPRALRNIYKYEITNDTLSFYTIVTNADLLHNKIYEHPKDSVRIRIDLVRKADTLNGKWMLISNEEDKYNSLGVKKQEQLIFEPKNNKAIVYYKGYQDNFDVEYYEGKIHILGIERAIAKQMNNITLYKKFKGEFVYEIYQDSLIMLDNYGTRLKFINE
jgi:heat shock protein HslJ